jgi:hypothetical protein
MFLLMRQNMEPTPFHCLLHERDLVVHLHFSIGQPSSHSNTSAAGANNSVVIQRHVSAIAAEHGTKDFIVSFMKGIWVFTYIPASANRRATATPALPAPTTE